MTFGLAGGGESARVVTRCKCRSSLDIGGMETETAAGAFFTERSLADLPGGLRPHDPQLDQARRAAQLQARRLPPDRPRRRRGLPRPAQGRGGMRRESPIKRRNPSGQVVWVARYTGRDGKRRIAKPTWNRGKGTFVRKAEAQRAIDEAYGLSDDPTPSATTSPPGSSDTPGQSGPTRPTSTGSPASPTSRSRASP